jgi:HEAT repeat protein
MGWVLGGGSRRWAAARERYRQRVRDQYARVDLAFLTGPGERDHPVMLLEQVFIAPRVRAGSRPAGVSPEVWQRLTEAERGGVTPAHVRMPDDRDPTEETRLRRAWFIHRTRPLRPVLDVLGARPGQRSVLLGGPGAGKTTVARYLMLVLTGQDGDRAAPGPTGPTGRLPLLIDLPTYTDPGWRAGRSGPVTFLDLIDHLHEAGSAGLPRNLLEPFLAGGGHAVVFFDGLDQVQDPSARERVVAEIEEFSARYPHAQVVVTSRETGYQHQPLTAAGFIHWTMQDFDHADLRAFAAGWYAGAFPADPSAAARLTGRFLAAVGGAVADPVAVNLSGNAGATARPVAVDAVAGLVGRPMLTTLLAVVGSRSELPRDPHELVRRILVELVTRWDVTDRLVEAGAGHGLFADPADRMELLRRVARGLQDGPSVGRLPGPDLAALVHAQVTSRFSLPGPSADVAVRVLLAQLEAGNGVLARFGPQGYGFTYRAFLDQLTAEDLFHQLAGPDDGFRDARVVYDRYGADPDWGQPLRLLAGMLPGPLAVDIAVRLLGSDPHWASRRTVPWRLLLGLRIAAETSDTSALAPHAVAINDTLISLLERAGRRSFRPSPLLDAVRSLLPLLGALGRTEPGRDHFRRWFLTQRRYAAFINGSSSLATYDSSLARFTARTYVAQLPNPPADLHRAVTHSITAVRCAAMEELAEIRAGDPEVLPWLRQRATEDREAVVRQVAVRAIGEGWAGDPAVARWMRELATTDQHPSVRETAVRAVGEGWAGDPAVARWMRELATTDQHFSVRAVAVRAVATRWPGDPATLPWLRERATGDPDYHGRQAAVQAIGSGWAEDPSTLPLLRERATSDPDPEVQAAAVRAIAAAWEGNLDVLPLLRERATTVDDYCDYLMVQEEAVPAIALGWAEDPGTLPLLLERVATIDDCENCHVRAAALGVLASGWPDDPRVMPLLRELATDGRLAVRLVAVRALGSGWAGDPDLVPLLTDRAAGDREPQIRQAAMEALVAGWADDPGTVPLLREMARADADFLVRIAAVAALVAGWADHPETVPLLVEIATDPDGVLKGLKKRSLRFEAMRVLVAGWAGDPAILSSLREIATTDPDEWVRASATDAVAIGWPEDPATLSLLRGQALDPGWWVRKTAVETLGVRWAGDPTTLSSLREIATTDPDGWVRVSATDAVAIGWPEDPATLPLLREIATTDPSGWVRASATDAVAIGWPEDPATLPLLQDRAVADPEVMVRKAAERS